MAIVRKTYSPKSYRRPVTASQNITASAVRRNTRPADSKLRSGLIALSPEKRVFANQIIANTKRQSKILAATNTSNIMAKPDFLELLPLFVQKLVVADVFGTVAMNSRQQIIPYFKVVAENTKGETHAGDVMNSPFANRQGVDPNYSGNLIKNEIAFSATAQGDFSEAKLMYVPILPGSVTISIESTTVGTKLFDDGSGVLNDATGTNKGYINYSTGEIHLTNAINLEIGDVVKATYQYDNETIGPHATVDNTFDHGQYGARMGKLSLQLDEFNMRAEAHQLACYWSVYSAFAVQNEYGANIGDMAKEAAVSEITAEINSAGFNMLKNAARYQPQYNWDATPVLSGAVVPSDYLNMFKLKLGQAAASVYQATHLTRPNRLVVGTTAAEYIAMINGFESDSIEDTVGPYHFGKLDQFEIYVDPTYDPTEWVMACKSNDIRRNSGLFGEYMPIMSTDAIGLADASVQQGTCTMYGMKVVNPQTTVSGKILGTF